MLLKSTNHNVRGGRPNPLLQVYLHWSLKQELDDSNKKFAVSLLQ
jgi:hypothetical protein